jgi:hypothetical protein
MNRRKFLRAAAVAPVALAVPTAIAAASASVPVPTYNPMPEMEAHWNEQSAKTYSEIVLDKVRKELEVIIEPYLFDYNEPYTRTSAKRDIDLFLRGMKVSNGIYDFMCVCDDTNNKLAWQVDKSEMHIDVAIQPSKSVDFIYIPIVVSNTISHGDNS